VFDPSRRDTRHTFIGDASPGGRVEPPGPAHVPLAPARADHQYLTASLGYADRVYDTLRALALDVVVFLDSGAAFTTLRAKRLLGEFAGTRRVVAAHPGGDPSASEPVRPCCLIRSMPRV
jgi:hypothetical protein